MNAKSDAIAHHNDQLRTTFRGGRVMVTQGINALEEEDIRRILEAVRSFDDFTEDNDPHGEHDFGNIFLDGIGRVNWKIDYYDTSIQYHSPNPGNRSVTCRVLTIMLSSEY